MSYERKDGVVLSSLDHGMYHQRQGLLMILKTQPVLEMHFGLVFICSIAE
jgi:hypothetical protein